MNDIKFSDWVIVDSRLKRQTGFKKNERAYQDDRIKYWDKIKTKKKKVLFLGIRYLFNGITPFDYDTGHSFTNTETIKAALVCEGPRANPFYVLLEDIKKIKFIPKSINKIKTEELLEILNEIEEIINLAQKEPKRIEFWRKHTKTYFDACEAVVNNPPCFDEYYENKIMKSNKNKNA